jgi:hypothetical protein
MVKICKLGSGCPGQERHENESTFRAIAKFDSQINSWGDLVWESGATLNRCTYPCFSRNLVDSVKVI